MTTRKNFPNRVKLRRQGAYERLQQRIKILSHEKNNDGKLQWSIDASTNLLKKGIA